MGGARRFWFGLGLVVLAAAALRVTYVVTVTRHDTERLYDATYYTLQAREIARGNGFTDPFAPLQGRAPEPAADHPPLLSILLAPAGAIDDIDASMMAMRFTTVLFGLGVVVMTALLGRVVAGDRVGLVAAVIAALSPSFWMNDGLIMAEAPAVFFTAVALWLTYRARVEDSWWWVAATGAVSGLAALTRAELALLVPLLVVPLALRRGPPRRALLLMGAGLLAAFLVVLPWFAYNEGRFEDRVLMSTNDGIALAGSNCDDAYYGELTGYTSLACLEPRPHGDQSQQSTAWRSRALDYAREHEHRIPVVVAARVARTWELWDPFEAADRYLGEGRPRWASLLGTLVTWVALPLAVGGLVAARRARRVVWPLLVPMIVATVTAVLTFGHVRLRAAAEPSIAVLVAMGIVALAAWWRRRHPSRMIEASSSS